MLLFRLGSQRTLLSLVSKPLRQTNWPCPVRAQLKQQFNFRLLQRRCYVQAPSPVPKTSSATKQELAKQAKSAASGGSSGKNYEIAETLLIYHAGTGRITFLAMLKVTTLFIGAFFSFIVVPGYIKSEKPEWETAGVALCGIIPLLFVAYTTSPFVTHIHIHLPAAARSSRPILERFVHGALPPSTELTVTTMSAIAKPRYSRLQAGQLRPERRRFGIINYVREGKGAAGTITTGATTTAAEQEGRKWYNLKAVTKFCVQDLSPLSQSGKGKAVTKVKKSRAVTETWIWDVIRDKIAKRAAAAEKKSA